MIREKISLKIKLIVLFVVLLPGLCVLSQSKTKDAIEEEWAIKREDVFEFVEKPKIKREKDTITISFETKGFCDVTIAIENLDKNIVRHLASGVLGPNAPEPFAKNSKIQKIVWDSKDDQGKYLDNLDSLVVRVSLGIKPQMERTLFWSTKRRANHEISRGLVMRATPEGVYVGDGGQAVDHIVLYSHKGDYLRTVYPFPAANIKNLKGILTTPFPQDNKVLPVKPSYQMCTLLTSGDNALNIVFKDGKYIQGPMDPCHKGEYGIGIMDLAVHGNKLAIGANRLNRITSEGTSGGLDFYGPWICQRSESGFFKATESLLSMTKGGFDVLHNLKPTRMAFSPDGKTLYFTRYTENFSIDGLIRNYWQNGVYKMNYEENMEPVLFLGGLESGSDANRFHMPTDVACDSKGRVYIADCGNHRVQIFSAEGTLLKTLPVEAPAQVSISPKDEIYVCTWEFHPNLQVPNIKVDKPNVMRKFKSFEDTTLQATYELPIGTVRGKYGQRVEIDYWAETPTVWINPGLIPMTNQPNEKRMVSTGLTIFSMKEKSLDFIRSFESDAKEAVIETMAPEANRQRLYWDPKREKLFVGEGSYFFQNAISIDPANGKLVKVNLPFDAEDMCFDSNGNAYLRTADFVGRYDPSNWNEVPFDYGEERDKVTQNTSSGRREARIVSGISLPTNSNWHHGGMSVSPAGNIAIGCLYLYGPSDKLPRGQQAMVAVKQYKPQLYPGRITNAVYGAEYVHVWDKFGKMLFDDAIKGLGTLNGVAIDNQNNLYVLSAGNRGNKDSQPFNYLAGTLMKFKPNQGKIISDANVPIVLSESEKPKRSPDLLRMPGNAWAEGVDWYYGGIGWHGKNNGTGCGCRNTRFALDYFGRSFAPEIDRYSVSVLDTGGNLILRIGTYGNINDGKPLIADGGPAMTRSIGGDEVALVHGAYVATQTDRRVFISDIGNYRVVSVALNYYATETVALADK